MKLLEVECSIQHFKVSLCTHIVLFNCPTDYYFFFLKSDLKGIVDFIEIDKLNLTTQSSLLH
jgi:hypothetical protein